MNVVPTESPATNPDTAGTTGEDLDHQRAAIAALGHELRALVDATVRTAAPTEVLHQMTDEVRRITGQLTGRRRTRAEIPAVDEFPGGVRMYSPVTGTGSPLAPPMQVTADSGGVVGRCTLGIAHEGPPGYGHGGMSAMLLDELMGWACAAAGLPGMTVSLQVRYRRPVPLEAPLRVYARVTGTEGREIFVDGSISTEEDPSAVAVTADGVFVSPDPGRTRALFPHVR
ncbi:PaaI family thioesterase [Streptomyces olivochromogenes]|uniref:Acyl-coenzyme A thioesterase THEM4 n=1 Tax=Streptomyces olivochromogenes TaxID=1963 RepID=A0A250VR13_STROL|nr:PaaI family thioesterase [Streptomyces olivochromogenes]KUN39017.1 thioesterase [Streptomyces olivochromogenes]GAX56514.1 aromatic compound degradation protein PaaI [Streptomyces olivochromogenes]